MKRNTRLTLFVRLLIAGVRPFLVVAVKRFLSEAFVAHWKTEGKCEEKSEILGANRLTITHVWPLASMLPLVNDEVTFASEFHVAEVAWMFYKENSWKYEEFSGKIGNSPRIFSWTTRICWDKYWLLHNTLLHKWHCKLKGGKFSGENGSGCFDTAAALPSYPPTFVCCRFAPWAFCTFAFVLFRVGCGCSMIWMAICCCGWSWWTFGCWICASPDSFKNAAYRSKIRFLSWGFVTSTPSSRFTVMCCSIFHWLKSFFRLDCNFFHKFWGDPDVAL